MFFFWTKYDCTESLKFRKGDFANYNLVCNNSIIETGGAASLKYGTVS